jgi:hypothetical protein
MEDAGHLAFYLTPIAVDDAPQSPGGGIPS